MRTDEDLSPADILAEWRAAERELVNCRQGSNDYDTLAARDAGAAAVRRHVVT